MEGDRLKHCSLGFIGLLAACATVPSSDGESASERNRKGKLSSEWIRKNRETTLQNRSVGVPKFSLRKKQTNNGSLQIVQVDLPRGFPKTALSSVQVTGEFSGKKISFYLLSSGSKKKGPVFQGLIGVPYRDSLGRAKVQVQYQDEFQKKTTELSFRVKKGKYRSEKLRVSSKKVTPPQSSIDRIIREKKEVDAIYQTISSERLWNGKFAWPVRSKLTSPYGTQRLYNGKMKNFHSGADLRAGVGTPIRAPARGRVVLAKDLYFSGNVVILDHGLGFYTLYAHLSKIRVKKGMLIKKGRVLGLAGATGRVNGPHLHWGAVIHEQKINPLDLIRELK